MQNYMGFHMPWQGIFYFFYVSVWFGSLLFGVHHGVMRARQHPRTGASSSAIDVPQNIRSNIVVIEHEHEHVHVHVCGCADEREREKEKENCFRCGRKA